MFKNFKKSSLYLKSNKSQTGFAVLFAVLLASFLITLGISIFSISLKEIMIATSLRDSQVAYYVADSARECALYWDIKQGAFPACLDSACTVVSTSSNPTIRCNSNNITLNFNHSNGSLIYSVSKTDFFQASSTSSSTPVSDISIDKTFNQDTSRVVTTIKAFGHNTGILGRRVERGIQQINN